MTTGFVFDERYLWHDTGSAGGYIPAGGFIQPEPHMESPESKRRFRNLLDVSGLLIIVPCGFDANVMDPLGRMMNTSQTFRSMTVSLKELANVVCRGRLLMVHEGGYSTAYVPFCGLAVMEALSEIKTEVQDPYLESCEHLPGQELQPHQDAVIQKCEGLAARVK